ncbi:MAG: hypothetical protein EU529_06555 [Promethearchaeota archaeon]|nr:MAG: hypothetical protein EU529_06555 [Candidatus Lokiarchaeota archaeon]
MKSRTFYLLVFFVFLVYFSIIIQENVDDNNDIESSSHKSEKRDKNNKTIKKADSWILSPFVIDDERGTGDYNWSEAADQDWCSGSGTIGDPYIIENVTINVVGSRSGIHIKDSDVYFINIKPY